MSQQLLEGSLAGAALENEEYLTTISTRLQAAVEKLLLAITETTNQVRHASLGDGNRHGAGPHPVWIRQVKVQVQVQGVEIGVSGCYRSLNKTQRLAWLQGLCLPNRSFR